jgi:hypothetical protein
LIDTLIDALAWTCASSAAAMQPPAFSATFASAETAFFRLSREA